MKTQALKKFFLLFVATPTLLVGLQGLLDPQAVMANVDLVLPNNSALSSTRALYGGVNLVYACFLIYAAFRAQREGLLLVSLYTSGYVIGRVFSLLLDGAPNPFISLWIGMEAVLAFSAIFLLRKKSPAESGKPLAAPARQAVNS